jgi:uncharacterized membrane protein YqjE
MLFCIKRHLILVCVVDRAALFQSKAPAVMLPATHLIRLASLLLSARTGQPSRRLLALASRHSFLMALSGAAMAWTVRTANAAGTFHATITLSSTSAKLIRAMVSA